MTVLVAYASKHGSTREVAERVAEGLRGAGIDVVVESAGRVQDLSSFTAVVVGAAIYAGRLHPEARTLLRRAEGVRLAVFAMGPDSLEESKLADSRKQLDHALRKAPVDPFAVTVFGGALDPRKLRFPFNRVPEYDARDWNAIDAWADEVAAALVPVSV